MDYRGARYYDSDIARFLSLDPLAAKYPMFSAYNYVAGNPLKYIDANGKEIVVPNESDRKAVLEMINSRARGTFAFDDKGKLYVVKKEGEERFSEYYRDKLIAAIESPKTITITITDKFTYKGIEYDVDGNAKGGATTKTEDGAGDDANTYISGNGNETLKDTEGQPLRDEPADILMHELVGHAIPIIKGTDTGNAIQNENKVRRQYKENGQVGESKLRKADPTHTEIRRTTERTR